MEKPVYIGILDDRVEIPYDQTSTKMGGIPHWIAGEPKDVNKLKCDKCGKKLALLTSAVCPVSPGYDRTLYLYICPKCGLTAKCYRQKAKAVEDDCVLATPTPEPEKPKVEIGAASKDDLMAAISSFDSFEPPAKGKGKGGKNVKKQKYEDGVFPAYYVDIDLEPEAQLDPDQKFIMASSNDSMGSASEFAGEEDRKDVDPILIEYNERISREPDQVLRYCFGGEPLLQDQMTIEVPKCPKCGADRCFEFEVIPVFINYLAPQNFDMDIGPILVYTCSRDCGEGSCEEHVIVCPP
ncbi:programmed cell death protein 2, putative [Trichomonas vaginalis G3]|uniref:Programmed cell death protein 2, putative n=1 Tax=Trichomonas vaginalis (strain ATCC PRA-98 / G3) TaxID=412133 RepID=A2G7Q2_TRIV3|nr:positive regulation of hematopoietic stem cell proliferation [Trichomonas vaginalis G3]EAX86812.1 programmed cell death protein 2, putative [Trichomonas vaginalis G3]KAI5544655.1 positive regulation of hematopoietic stem cell proliferation [Trichomonas vaginalis G3]|eukprot:XP_001299742.1 programmed cell death protein 2 [Trichomonas vaginalis G3]